MAAPVVSLSGNNEGVRTGTETNNVGDNTGSSSGPTQIQKAAYGDLPPPTRSPNENGAAPAADGGTAQPRLNQAPNAGRNPSPIKGADSVPAGTDTASLKGAANSGSQRQSDPAVLSPSRSDSIGQQAKSDKEVPTVKLDASSNAQISSSVGKVSDGQVQAVNGDFRAGQNSKETLNQNSASLYFNDPYPRRSQDAQAFRSYDDSKSTDSKSRKENEEHLWLTPYVKPSVDVAVKNPDQNPTSQKPESSFGFSQLARTSLPSDQMSTGGQAAKLPAAADTVGQATRLPAATDSTIGQATRLSAATDASGHAQDTATQLTGRGLRSLLDDNSQALPQTKLGDKTNLTLTDSKAPSTGTNRVDIIDKIGSLGPHLTVEPVKELLTAMLAGKKAEKQPTLVDQLREDFKAIVKLPNADKAELVSAIKDFNDPRSKLTDLSPKSNDLIGAIKGLKTQDIEILLGVLTTGRKPNFPALQESLQEALSLVFKIILRPEPAGKVADKPAPAVKPTPADKPEPADKFAPAGSLPLADKLPPANKLTPADKLAPKDKQTPADKLPPATKLPPADKLPPTAKQTPSDKNLPADKQAPAKQPAIKGSPLVDQPASGRKSDKQPSTGKQSPEQKSAEEGHRTTSPTATVRIATVPTLAGSEQKPLSGPKFAPDQKPVDEGRRLAAPIASVTSPLANNEQRTLSNAKFAPDQKPSEDGRRLLAANTNSFLTAANNEQKPASADQKTMVSNLTQNFAERTVQLREQSASAQEENESDIQADDLENEQLDVLSLPFRILELVTDESSVLSLQILKEQDWEKVYDYEVFPFETLGKQFRRKTSEPETTKCSLAAPQGMQMARNHLSAQRQNLIAAYFCA